MATALSEPSTALSVAVPDLPASEADYDQLPSTPALDIDEGEDEAGIDEDEEDDGDGEEGEEDGEDEGANEGEDAIQGQAEEGDDLDEYEVIEDADPQQLQNGNQLVNGEGADADELLGDEDTLGLGTYTEAEPGGEEGEGDGELPTVVIEFEETLFDLFAQQAGQDSGENAIPLKASPGILDQPLSALFRTLRIPDALGEFLEKDTLLLLRSPEVELDLIENDPTAEQVLLQDFLDIHPSNANGAAVRLRFSQRQPFLSRFISLGGVVNQLPAAKHSPTTAVSSWMSQANVNSRRRPTGEDEADELDDDLGDADGVLGEHHEPDVDDEGREAEWDEGGADAEVQDHWAGGEGEGYDGEEDGDDDDVILVEDDDANAGPQHEEAYDEGDHEALEEGEGEEDDDEEEDEEEDENAEYDIGEPTGTSDPSQEARASAAPDLAAWREPASSASGVVDTNGHATEIAHAALTDNNEDGLNGAAPSDAALLQEVDALGATSSVVGKRSFDESTEPGLDGPEDDAANKRIKV